MESPNPQSLRSFHEDVEMEEQRGDFHQALTLCVSAMKSIKTILSDPAYDVTPYQRLELQLLLDQATARSKFLLGVICIESQAPIQQLENSATNNYGPVRATPLQQLPAPISHGPQRVDDRQGTACEIYSKPVANAVVSTRSNSRATLYNTLSRRRDVNIYETLSPKDETRNIRRRLLQSFQVEVPDVSMKSVIGMKSAKNAIMQAVRIPIDFPDSAQAKDPWNGILLFGVSIEINYV